MRKILNLGLIYLKKIISKKNYSKNFLRKYIQYKSNICHCYIMYKKLELIKMILYVQLLYSLKSKYKKLSMITRGNSIHYRQRNIIL